MTCASFRIASAVPLIVGGRQTIVGIAPGTSRSIANCFVPVTISSASIRGCGVPTSVCCEAGFSCASTACVREAAAALVSEPYESDRPSGAVTTPSLSVSLGSGASSCWAAVSASWPRAIAAATRTWS